MDYQQMMLEQSAANSAFNAEQSKLNRDWQEYMSGTAHQREVNDLIAAGINPVLSANSGASWQSVGNAAADPTGAQGLMNLALTRMNNEAQIQMNKTSANATLGAAGATAGATMAAAATSANAQLEAARINQQTARDAASTSVSFNTPIGGASVTMPSYMTNQALEALNSISIPGSSARSLVNSAGRSGIGQFN